jgi:hypothetical protein
MPNPGILATELDEDECMRWINRLSVPDRNRKVNKKKAPTPTATQIQREIIDNANARDPTAELTCGNCREEFTPATAAADPSVAGV